MTNIPFYVYKITLKSTGQYYFGSRTANVRHRRLPRNDLWCSYFTSSNTIKRLVKEFGAEAFAAEVIYESFDDNKIYWFEQNTIKEHINNPQCLNKKFQDNASGHTVFSTTGKPSWNKGLPSPFKGQIRSQEIRDKISRNRKGKGLGIIPKSKGLPVSEERKQIQSDKMRGRFVGAKNHFFGKTHSDQVKQMIAQNTSLHQKGRPKIKTPCPHCGLPCAPHTLPRHLKFKHDS